MPIHEFDDYRRFIRQFLAQQPRKGRGQIKALGEYLRIDPSQVSQVLAGAKDFSEEQAFAAARFMGLNELDTEYLLTLVKIERAGTRDLKQHYTKQRDGLKKESLNLRHRVNQDRILSDLEKSIFYSTYLYSAVRLFTSTSKDGRSLSEVCEQFQIPRERAAKLLEFLVRTGLCEESAGRYSMGVQHTHVERDSPFLARHHHNWRVRALQRTDHITDQELQFTGPVSISKEDFARVREILVEAIQNSLARVKASEPTELACLLIDWIRIES